MNTNYTKDIFMNDKIVNYYDNLTVEIGLLKSEKIIFDKYIKLSDKILDLGCGAGRTTVGLYQNGYKNIVGIDISEKMVERSRKNASMLNYPICFEISDVLSLPFESNSFDVVFFSFNGLMLIPHKANRNIAITEIYRVLEDNGYFIFSTPYLDNKLNMPFWIQRMNELKIDVCDENYGDIFLEDLDVKNIYVHIPMSSEISEALNNNAFGTMEMIPRINICIEDEHIESQLDENMYWVAKKK